MRKKGNRLISLVVLLCCCSCTGTLNKTNIKEVDDKYTFSKKEDISIDSIRLKRYLLTTNQDSVFNMIIEPNRISKGWTYKYVRIGDWVFENSNQIDSIYNYVNYCGGLHKISSIKYFNGSKPEYTKGRWHEFVYDSLSVKLNEPFDLKITTHYDKELYRGNFMMLLFRDPVYNADYCDINSFVKDSLPSYGKDYYELRVTPTEKGVNTVQGCYFLLPNNQPLKVGETVGSVRVFFRLDFNVK